MAVGCTSSKVAAQDVTVTACQADPGGGRPTAAGMIVNHSSKASTYVVGVTFLDSAGNKVSQAGATVGKVEPGATSTFQAQGGRQRQGPSHLQGGQRSQDRGAVARGVGHGRYTS